MKTLTMTNWNGDKLELTRSEYLDRMMAGNLEQLVDTIGSQRTRDMYEALQNNLTRLLNDEFDKQAK